MTLDQNREAWLIKAAEAMLPWFAEIGIEVPPFRVSVAPLRATTAGECWDASGTEDGVAQIFVTAARNADKTMDVLGTLLHEMVHAVAGHEAGHKKGFIDIARPLGFVKKWTSSENRSDALTEKLIKLTDELGDFPHAALLSGQAADVPKKQGTRMLKLEAPCGYVVRTTQKWIDEGLPTCPHGDEMVQA